MAPFFLLSSLSSFGGVWLLFNYQTSKLGQLVDRAFCRIIVLLERIFSGGVLVARGCVGSNGRIRFRFDGGRLDWWEFCEPFRQESWAGRRLWRQVVWEFRLHGDPNRPHSPACPTSR
jgi:hypothetical protein